MTPADLIQNPADPKGVALVLIGPKGIGKTFFGEMICSLVGDKYSFITAQWRAAKMMVFELFTNSPIGAQQVTPVPPTYVADCLNTANKKPRSFRSGVFGFN